MESFPRKRRSDLSESRLAFSFWNRLFGYYIGIGEYTPFDL